MRIKLEQFSGVAPKVPPHKLPDTMAQDAQNLRFDRMKLEPFYGREVSSLTVPVNTKTLFLHEDIFWMTSTTEKDFVRAPIANDPFKYLFIFEDGEDPRITRNDVALSSQPYPAITYPLNLPSPTQPIDVTVGGVPPPQDEQADIDQTDVSYTYTFVDSWGRESEPAPPSDIVSLWPDEHGVLTVPQPPGGNFLFGAGAKIRLYKTNTGSTGGVFQYLVDLAIGTTTYDDNVVTDEQLGEAIPSVNWNPAPDTDASLNPDGPLFNVIAMPGQFLAGVTRKEICFSVQNVFHAWPVEYRKPIKNYEIVGLALMGENLFIATNGRPFVAYGGTPESMAITEIESNQACVSKDSIVSMEGAVLYASPDGLCLVQGSSVSVITEELFTKNEWAALVPESIKAFYYEGLYIGFYDKGIGGKGGFIFDIRGAKNAWSWLNFSADAGYWDVKTDTLYLSQADGTVSEFSLEATLTDYTWKSKLFRLDQEVNFALVQIYAESYPVEIVIDAHDSYGNTFSQTAVCDSKRPVYLESGFMANDWEFSITSTIAVNSVTLAETFQEVD